MTTEIMNQKTVILGIDGGVSGGIAVSRDGIVSTFAMCKTEADTLGLLRQACDDPGNAIVFLEDMVKFAGKNQAASHAIVYGRSFGFLLGVCQALGVRVELVKPATWQLALGLGNSKSCINRTAWKNKCKALAQRLYPQLSKITLATSDAILIMEYGLRQQATIPAAIAA